MRPLAAINLWHIDDVAYWSAAEAIMSEATDSFLHENTVLLLERLRFSSSVQMKMVYSQLCTCVCQAHHFLPNGGSTTTMQLRVILHLLAQA